MRKKIIEQGIRPDGRGVTEIRPIWCEVGVLPRVHGSAVFTRGQTQALTVTTLGSTSEGQVLDGLSAHCCPSSPLRKSSPTQCAW